MSAPTLDDDQIDTMRRSVMHRIDQDVTRRGRRARRALGLVAAGVLVLGTGTLGLGLLDVRSGGSSSQADRSVMGGAGAADAPAPEGGDLATTRETAPAADRQVVTTGTITVTVADPRAVAQQVSSWVESVGGRIDDRAESGRGDDASASVTVRVPSARVTATIEQLGTYGTVDDVTVGNSDVTAQATDLDARIAALRLSIDRLGSIMAGAGSSQEVIRAEEALTQRQEQLESLQAQRKAIADQVSLSTLSITLSQRTGASSVEPGGFAGGLRDGWNGLVSTVNRVVEVAGILLPWAAAAGVVLAVTRLIGRLRRTRTP